MARSVPRREVLRDLQCKVENVSIGDCLSGRCESHSCQRRDDEERASIHGVFDLRSQEAALHT